jgi:riboflavin synthase
VAVDGVSLTVVHVQSDRFSVALIPHTLSMTTLGQVQPGSRVNIENDILGKYVDHLLQGRLAALHPAGPATSNSSQAASFATMTLTESPAPQ